MNQVEIYSHHCGSGIPVEYSARLNLDGIELKTSTYETKSLAIRRLLELAKRKLSPAYIDLVKLQIAKYKKRPEYK